MILRFSTLFSFLLILACATPLKKYNKQDYNGAAKMALKNLAKGKATNQSRNILEKSMVRIIKEDSGFLAEWRNSNVISKWEKALKQSEKLQEKIIDTEPYLGNVFAADLARLSDDDLATEEKLYDHYYEEGKGKLDQYINSGYKSYAQQAYFDFNEAYKYSTTVDHIDSLLQLCLDYGTLVYNVDAGATFELSQEWEIDRMFDDVDRESSRFLAVYYKVNVPGIDCELEVDFGSIDFRVKEDRETLDFEKEVKDGFRTEKDTSGNTVRIPVYKTVTGGVVINRRVRTGEWEAGVRIRAYTRNCELDDRYFASRRESEAIEYETFGDERAIPDNYRKDGKGRLISEDEMAEEMLEDIYSDFVGFYF